MREVILLSASTSRGLIEPGMRADLVVLEGNPLVNISNIRRVIGRSPAGNFFSPPRCGITQVFEDQNLDNFNAAVEGSLTGAVICTFLEENQVLSAVLNYSSELRVVVG